MRKCNYFMGELIMYCKYCGSYIDDNAVFCAKCGNRVERDIPSADPNNNDEQILRDVTLQDDVYQNKAVNNEGKIHANEDLVDSNKEEKPKFLKILFKIGIIAAIVGAVLFFGIVIVGLIGFGRVYLFGGYGYTKVLTIISIVLMLAGSAIVAIFIVIHTIKNPKEFTKKIYKKILLIVLIVASIAFSVWGFSDCVRIENSRNGVSGGSNPSIGVNFFYIYSASGCDEPWAEVGADNYLYIDTNPYDYDSDSSLATLYAPEALEAITEIHRLLDIPSYIYDEMLSTTAIDGVQSYSGSRVNITWRYHPDRGLEVRYTNN